MPTITVHFDNDFSAPPDEVYLECMAANGVNLDIKFEQAAQTFLFLNSLGQKLLTGTIWMRVTLDWPNDTRSLFSLFRTFRCRRI